MTEDKSSWRQIQQQLTSPAITPVAQRRRRFLLLKKLGLLALVILLVSAVAGILIFVQRNSRTIAPYATAGQRTQIIFFSDGQLTTQWFNERFPSIRTKGLLSIDISSLQKILLRNPQVLTASVERHFPSTLKITLRERLPLGRVKVKNGPTTTVYYIAPDGEFYTSSDYHAPANLPFIISADLISSGGKLLPLSGANTLAELIDGLKHAYPDLAAQIAYIDLKGWVFPVTSQTSVAIRLRDGTTLRFGGQNVPAQLDRLREVFALLRDEKQTLKNKTVDLTDPERVPIITNK